MGATPDKFGIQADPSGKFRQALREASEECSNLTVPLMLIAKEWFKGNRAIFKLKGPGKYADLSGHAVRPITTAKKTAKGPSNLDIALAGYKLQKQKRWGFIYPILRASGALEKSITDPTSEHAISQVINKQVLYLGSSIKYAEYLQTGTKKMPSRPYVLIGAEQTGPEQFNQRFQAFTEIIAEYVRQTLLRKVKNV